MNKLLIMVLFASAACAVHPALADELPPRPGLLEPTWILKPSDTHLRLDAWNYDSFTTDTDGNVTVWADQSGNGHDATAYQIGDDQVYGTVGVTNGVPAYLMGPIASRIDLVFERCATIRTVFWVMDIAGNHRTEYDKLAFFLGDSYEYGYDFHRGYEDQIAGPDANAAFRDGVFRVDGDDSYSGNLTTMVPPSGLHLYTSVPTDNLAAGQLSRDRVTSTVRCGGRALSELIILTRPLANDEVETVEQYLRTKWFGAMETVTSEVVARAAYPSLTLDADAGLVIGPATFARKDDAPSIAVFGTLKRGTAEKVRIVSSVRNVMGSRTLLACGATDGIASIDDFEFVGFPPEAQFAWDGAKLTMTCDRAYDFVPAVLHAAAERHASLWLDATDAASFTTNETGGVTAWADKSGSGNDALSYQLGDEQKYGVRGVTNGCPAFLMGLCGSDVDLRFAADVNPNGADNVIVRAAYWVMDIVRDCPYDDGMKATGWPTAFFLGGDVYYDFHRAVEGRSFVAGPDAAESFRSSDFRIDGVATDPTVCEPALGTHVYSAQMSGDAHAAFLSNDRGLARRNGGRALSELILFGFELTESEKTQMANYLNAKWHGAEVTLTTETNAVTPISFPNLVLNEGAGFRVCSASLRTAAAGVSVFGALRKGTAEKVRIAFVGTPIGFGVRTIFECANVFGYEKSDFEVTGLPDGITPYWEGNALKINLAPSPVEPTVLRTVGSSAPWIWLDASDVSTFTTTDKGGVTAWADKGTRGHDATAYVVGDDQVYGTVGLTNGVPAYLMGASASRIDLTFETCSNVRTVFWVMDLEQNIGADDSKQPFLLGGTDTYDFHRGESGALCSFWSASPNLLNADFAIDGDHSCSGKLSSTYPLIGTHLYSAETLGDCSANRLTCDRDKAGRSGGRALSELAIFNRVLTSAEYASVENYLNAKWFGKGVTVSEPVSVTSPVTYPFLTLDEGASFTLSRAALPKNDAAVTVFGSLAKDMSGKVRISLAGGETLPGGVRTLLRCADGGGLALDDFELIGFPEGAKFAWDGRDLTVTTTPGLVISIR